MLSINTNISSLIAQRAMQTSTDRLNQAVERMSTGFKINHAKGNAANYSISTNMNTQINAYDVAADNVAMGMDLVTTASDIISQMQDKASRLQALSTQARNGTYGTSSLNAINSEASAIMAEINRLYMTAEYNNISLFNRQEYTIAPHLPQAGESGFIDESALPASEPPTAKAEYGGFIADPKTYEQSYVDALDPVSSVVPADGFTESEYKVATVNDLVALADLVNNKGLITSGVTFILADNIDLGEYCDESIADGEGGWTPIGNSTNSFEGTFDGNGNVIKNLKIDRDADSQGLFGRVTAGELKNVGIVSAEVKGINDVAVLAGYAGVPIINSYTIGNVTGTTNVGGLIGYSDSSVTNSYTTGNVSGKTHVGGLAGYTDSTIINSYAKGDVIGQGDFVGGLAGLSDGIVEGCYATGDIEATGKYAGGLIGNFTGEITNSYATGNVIGIQCVGGLSGRSETNTNVTNCFATGNVKGSTSVGGLIGLSHAIIKDSYATGNVHNNGYNLGGLVGDAYQEIINCYASGNVNGNTFVGGLVGMATESIDNCYAVGTVNGERFVGGLVGQALRTSLTKDYSNCSVYSRVNSTNAELMGSFIGGIVVTYDGVNFGVLNITNCKSIEQDMADIGGCYKHESLDIQILLPDYDMSAILAGISDVEFHSIITTLQVGTTGDESCQLNFDTNFEYDLSAVEDISSIEAFNSINEFLALLSEKSTQLGAIQNRLDSALESIEVNLTNLTSSLSTIRDADIAEVSAEYIQQQILQQAAATLMSTANQSPSIALQLI